MSEVGVRGWRKVVGKILDGGAGTSVKVKMSLVTWPLEFG
jgi:hypothetical protein